MADQKSHSGELLTEKYPGEIFQQIQGEITSLRGWPGYRNRPGRFGTDPLDSDFELAHLQGVLLRKLIIGQVFTINPFYLTLMTFYGIVGISPLILSIVGAFHNSMILLINIPLILHELLGIVLIRNVINSLIYSLKADREMDQQPIIP